MFFSSNFHLPTKMKNMANSKNDIVIEVKDLVKRFGSFVADDHLTFNVYKGEIFGFLGANGAGKTTAIRMLCGLLQPTSGDVKVAGFDAYTQSNLIKANIGYMSQKFSLYNDLSVWENIRFFGGIYGLWGKELKYRADELINNLQMNDSRDVLISSLPLGWRQRLSFAVSMIHKPPIVFLDEPTGGVDPIARRQFWEMINEVAASGTTVFVTTHYMDEAEYCHRVAILVDGKMVALNTPANLKKEYSASSMNEVFISLARQGQRVE
ncbi:MAG: ABC transporter ATP-binding protein [Bacteroidales bacterium]|nr:MAG: ABC transporter ATP-binding protein [Bacteroidales bacterium]